MKITLMIAASFLIAGCATAPKLPPELIYTPPTEPASSLAFIRGHIVKSKVPFFDSFNTYIYAIDGKRVIADKKNWKLPVALLAGNRTITAGFEQGIYTAFAKVDVPIVAGSTYEIRSDCPSSPIGKPFTYCDFWVVDVASNKPISEVMRSKVGGQVPMILTL